MCLVLYSMVPGVTLNGVNFKCIYCSLFPTCQCVNVCCVLMCFVCCVLQGYHTMSPNHEVMSGLPPMSSFRGGTIPQNSSAYPSPSPTINGSDMVGGHQPHQPPGSSQTGDALGKALTAVSSRSKL